MARIGISFKDNSPEEMRLYKEILKRSCGSPSHYIKGVFREIFEMDGYIYRVQRTKKEEEQEQAKQKQDEPQKEDKSSNETAVTVEEEPTNEQDSNPTVDDEDLDIEIDDDDEDIELDDIPEVKPEVKKTEQKDEDEPVFQTMDISGWYTE